MPEIALSTLRTNSRSRVRKNWYWPVAGLVLALLVGLIPLKSDISLQAGITVWCVALALVLILPANPVGARVGALIGGLAMTVPGFVERSPLGIFLMLCLMAMPCCASVLLVFAPPIDSLRARLAYLFTWCGTRPVKRRAPGFNAAAFWQLLAATVVLAAALAGVQAASDLGNWRLPVRWLAGGTAVFAFAEMATAGLPLASSAFGLIVPQLMQSPWRAASLDEFWARRWNIATSALFRTFCFIPLARWSAVLALFVTFAASAVGHALLALAALGRWQPSLYWGAFFLLQPIFIILERWMHVRRWRSATRRAWTLAVLAITSPLFVEPALQITGVGTGGAPMALASTAVALVFVMIVCVFFALASLAARPAEK